MSQPSAPDRPPARPPARRGASAPTAATVTAKPRWYEALLAWYLGWLGRVFSGRL